MATKRQAQRIQDQITATAELRKLCPEGTTVYCIVRSVAKSGMSRNIDCYVVYSGELRWISSYMASAMGLRWGKSGPGLRVTGGGMDMCFALVYKLAQYLYGADNGRKLNHCTT